MSRMNRKILALLCGIVMLVSLIPVGVAAAADTVVVYDMQEDVDIKGKADGATIQGSVGLVRSGSPTITVKDAAGGKKSLLVTGRTQGYFGVDIRPELFMNPDAKLTITVKGHLPEGMSTNNAILQATGAKADGTYYAWLVNRSVAAGGSFELTTTKSINDIIAANGIGFGKFQIQLQEANIDFYIDDIIITSEGGGEVEPVLPTGVLIDENFEDYKGTIVKDGDVELVTLSTNFASSGTHSLLVQNPSSANNYSGVVLNNDRLASPGMKATGKYRLTAKIYAVGPETVNPRINVRVDSTTNASDSWGDIKNQRVDLKRNEWVDVTVEFEVPENHEIVKRIAFINAGQQTGLKYYIDDVKLEVLREPVAVVQAAWEDGLPSLYKAYEDYFMFGNILEPSILNRQDTLDMFKHQYNAVSLENSMKPVNMVDFVNNKMVFTFNEADKVVAWAEANGIAVHGHTLVWHAQSEARLTNDASGNPLTRAQAKANLEEFISVVAGHYKGKVISWDVVNEAVSGGGYGNANANTGSPWRRAYANGMDTAAGEAPDDYIYDAFVFTRLADPGAVLYYNDFNEHLAGPRVQISNMVKKYNDRWAADARNTEPERLLIEGVGMQAHYWTGEEVSLLSNVKAAFDLYRTLGVEISVSELDIPAGKVGGPASTATAEEKEAQAKLYAQLFNLYKENADIITRVTLWGRDDASSWRSGPSGSASPLHFDSKLKAKPAFWAMLDPAAYLKSIEPPPPFEAPMAFAEYGTPVLGTNAAAWDAATVIDVTQQAIGKAAATGKARVLWDEQFIYVRVEVTDAVIDTSSSNEWEKDSVEIFLSETNYRGGYSDAQGNQYRIDANGGTSQKTNADGWGTGSGEGYSFAERTDYGYIVEFKLPWRDENAPAEDHIIGFEVQINDPPPADRPIVTWSDPKADGYNSSIQWGEVTLLRSIVTYTVSFDSAGGSEVAPVVAVAGTAVERPEDPTREGYTFAGWYLDGETFDFDTAIDGDITLVAEWDANFISAAPSAYVEKLNGNKNRLYITIVEEYFDGTIVTITWDGLIDNNAAGVYEVAGYNVYVGTKGNTQVRECYIVE